MVEIEWRVNMWTRNEIRPKPYIVFDEDGEPDVVAYAKADWDGRWNLLWKKGGNYYRHKQSSVDDKYEQKSKNNIL